MKPIAKWTPLLRSVCVFCGVSAHSAPCGWPTMLVPPKEQLGVTLCPTSSAHARLPNAAVFEYKELSIIILVR